MTKTERAMIWLGGGALLLAAVIDFIAVTGRHLGFPLRGSIELVQASVLVAGSIAIIAATRGGNHAQVHLLLDKLNPLRRRIADSASNILAALFILALFAGCFWIATDLWSGQEQSELLGLAYRWMRAFSLAAVLAVAATFALNALRGRRS
jgi:TRAP-type transport system small permease protein